MDIITHECSPNIILVDRRQQGRCSAARAYFSLCLATPDCLPGEERQSPSEYSIIVIATFSVLCIIKTRIAVIATFLILHFTISLELIQAPSSWSCILTRIIATAIFVILHNIKTRIVVIATFLMLHVIMKSLQSPPQRLTCWYRSWLAVTTMRGWHPRGDQLTLK